MPQYSVCEGESGGQTLSCCQGGSEYQAISRETAFAATNSTTRDKPAMRNDVLMGRSDFDRRVPGDQVRDRAGQ